jgi:hypothetical protein
MEVRDETTNEKKGRATRIKLQYNRNEEKDIVSRNLLPRLNLCRKGSRSSPTTIQSDYSLFQDFKVLHSGCKIKYQSPVVLTCTDNPSVVCFGGQNPRRVIPLNVENKLSGIQIPDLYALKFG